MPKNQPPQDDLDIVALFDALAGQRIERQLNWRGMANQIWN
jgi:hypothetical protein